MDHSFELANCWLDLMYINLRKSGFDADVLARSSEEIDNLNWFFLTNTTIDTFIFVALFF